MRDHLIQRRPPIKPSDDHWMLDLWGAPELHLVGVVYRELSTSTRRYRTACACGWRSDESDAPLLAECPVASALDERARRSLKFSDVGRKKSTEHVVWLPLDKPVSSK